MRSLMSSPLSPAPRRAVGAAVCCLLVATMVTTQAGPGAAATIDARQQAYETVAAAYGVPDSVLLAVSYLESRWDVNAGAPSTSAGFGPMHLTDAVYVASLPGFEGDEAEDPRGDDARPAPILPGPTEEPGPTQDNGTGLETLTEAVELTGLDPQTLRTVPEANIRGGAALLAQYQQDLGAPTGVQSDPADWYGAVARYSGATEAEAAQAFADEVYATLATGATRTTDDGHPVVLGGRSVTPNRSWLDRLGLPRHPRPDGLECPRAVSCEWIPAPYQLLGDGTVPTKYGNHDLGQRPEQQKIEYIVIHDAEGYFDSTVRLVQDPAYVSWHYTIRSTDGHIAQHVKTKDVGWHAGNWYVNAKAVGIEHEGFAAQGTWYTEAMYRTSAKLVRYLAMRLGIPLDRAHIIGHDNVPGTIPTTVAGMHWDPGPYWDWSHYFELMGAPLHGSRVTGNGLVTILPDFRTNQPAFTGCTGTRTTPCPVRGSAEVILHSAPAADAPLVTDVALHPNGSPSTMYISDHGARASTGQRYAVAERRGDWTAIWYLGQKAWFYNPASAPTAVGSPGFVVTPKPGRTTIPVYGRAYPEAAAYPAGVPPQAVLPLQYTLSAGQRYSFGGVRPSEYYRAVTFAGTSPADWTVIRGTTTYVQIQFGHRLMFVNLDDVRILPTW
jgi:hypothetical protein